MAFRNFDPAALSLRSFAQGDFLITPRRLDRDSPSARHGSLAAHDGMRRTKAGSAKTERKTTKH
jgi:hypothetical protein